MAERKSVNKYYPPDWDPSKGSINNYVGQHPLRDRAKKLGQGILVIRFEMPYNIWCGGCNSHIGMGVRYNAEKTKTGNYYTTPIYKFRMKCHLCDNYFEIQTDPKNHDYVILEGARRKEQRWDPKENEQIVPEDKATQKKMATDAMFKLEHGSDDVKRGQKVKANLGSLEARREEWKDDFILNKIARQKFREEKKYLKKVDAADEALLTKSSLDIQLVKETDDDVRLAGLMNYRALETYNEKQAQKRQAIEDRPLFTSSKKHKPDSEDGSDNSNKLDIIRKQVRMGKTGRNSGPFDRMNMNSCKSMNTLTQTSLGIRRKSKDSTKQTTVTSTDSNENKHVENQDGQISKSVVETSDVDELNPENERLAMPNEIENTLIISGISDSNKKDNVSCDNSSNQIANSNMSSKVSPQKDKDNEHQDLAKTLESDTDSKVKTTSGLSLVSSYSDSDTDSSSG